MMSKLILTHVVLPVLVVACVFVVPYNSFIANVIAQTLLLILFMAGYWEFFGQRFRSEFLGLLELILIIRMLHRASPGIVPRFNLLSAVIMLAIELFLLNLLVRIIIVKWKKDKGALEIQFPFKGSVYLITDGGNSKLSRLMNYHYHSSAHRKKSTNNSMKFATDIIRIDPPYKSFFPKENENYPIFGETVYCPVDGTVFTIENSIDDNKPYAGNYPYNTGNTIVIKRDDLYFLLGHLMRGSVKVTPGETVTAGEEIALAGNSGMSERPHIHIQAIRSDSDNFWSGEGVSVRFRNENLYKNRIVQV